MEIYIAMITAPTAVLTAMLSIYLTHHFTNKSNEKKFKESSLILALSELNEFASRLRGYPLLSRKELENNTDKFNLESSVFRLEISLDTETIKKFHTVTNIFLKIELEMIDLKAREVRIDENISELTKREKPIEEGSLVAELNKEKKENWKMQVKRSLNISSEVREALIDLMIQARRELKVETNKDEYAKVLEKKYKHEEDLVEKSIKGW